MSVFSMPDFDNHEEVVFVRNEAAGLSAIIAIHNTALGPACGGTRMWPYASDDEATKDALRLARGMTYKSAMAKLPLGGGKAVIIGDAKRDKTEKLLLAHARAVDQLGGRYITAMDVNMTPDDMRVIARGTKHVAGFTQAGKAGGDSGPMTALGVFVSLKAAVEHRLKTDKLKGIRVAVQGLGAVGFELCQHLHKEGAVLIVSDLNSERAAKAETMFGAKTVSPDHILSADADVLSPCALGAVINDRTLSQLKAKVIVGGANNQLAEDRHGDELMKRGALFAPDYVANGGGIIRVAGQIFNWSDGDIETRVRAIATTLREIFVRADSVKRPTNVIADEIARERVSAGRRKSAKGLAAE
jgi:leucine dehydrogenase